MGKEEQEYIATNGNLCYFCGSKDIDAEKPTQYDEVVHVEVNCNKCEGEWIEVYVLSNVIPLG